MIRSIAFVVYLAVIGEAFSVELGERLILSGLDHNGMSKDWHMHKKEETLDNYKHVFHVKIPQNLWIMHTDMSICFIENLENMSYCGVLSIYLLSTYISTNLSMLSTY